MTGFDLSPLFRSSIGYERLPGLLDRAAQNTTTFPPYDIVAVDEQNYRITMAVAGFTEDELTLQVEGPALTVSGDKASQELAEGEQFLHRGIARRSFQQRFRLAEHVQVTDAALADGLLTISLEREIPEAQRPRTIPIGQARLQPVADAA